MQRRHFKPIVSFPDRLSEEVARLRAEAEKSCPMGLSGIWLKEKQGKPRRAIKLLHG